MTKNAVSKKTERILLRILKYLEEEKDRLNMVHWGAFHEDDQVAGVDHKMQPVPPCKITSCLGGTCLLVTKKGIQFLKDYGFFEDKYDGFPDAFDPAKKILGLTDQQAARLFFLKEHSCNGGYGWPEKYSNMYKAAKTGKGRFKATKLRVLHFIKTGY
jgi:hypothetical protein